MTYDLCLCNWRVSSEIPIREALPWSGSPAAEIDLKINLGELPHELEQTVFSTPTVRISADGSYLLNLPGIAKYLVQKGNKITIEPDCPLDSVDLRLFVQTSCLNALTWQRNFLSFNGAVVEKDGMAVALLGRGGVGKSTMAKALLQKGYRLMADDQCILDQNQNAMATLPDIGLWQDTLDHFNLTSHGLLPNRTGQQKYHVPCPDNFKPGCSPISALVIMVQNTTASTGTVTLTQLKGASALGQLGQTIQRRPLAKILDRAADIMTCCHTLVRQRKVFNLNSQKGLAHVNAGASAIDELITQLKTTGGTHDA
ncbi:hypothetical protein [Terasakiella pusilla]|uniref:hypothetical protein n=1 Tax=Terasakiella pusilla TaxID=64973 RepID=UPI003AA992FC